MTLTFQATADVSRLERGPLDLGLADARVVDRGIAVPVRQTTTGRPLAPYISARPLLAEADVLKLLPDGSRVAPLQVGRNPWSEKSTDDVAEADLGRPLAQGLFSLSSGRYPSAPHEVLVGQGAPAAYRLLDQINRRRDPERRMTVVGEYVTWSGADLPILVSPPDSGLLVGPAHREWLVDSPSPIALDEMATLNAAGLFVTSPALLRLTPPAELPTRPAVLLALALSAVAVVPLARRGRPLPLAVALCAGTAGGVLVAWLLARLLVGDRPVGPFELPWRGIGETTAVYAGAILLALGLSVVTRSLSRRRERGGWDDGG